MATATKFSLYHLFLGVASAVSLVLLATLVTQMLSQSQALGEHSARLGQIEASVIRTGDNIVNLQHSMSEGFAKTDGNFERLSATLDKNATDPASMIASLGLAEPGEIFGAVIYNNALWAFPANEAMAVRLQASGLQREQVNSALHGFKVMPISAVGIVGTPQNQ